LEKWNNAYSWVKIRYIQKGKTALRSTLLRLSVEVRRVTAYVAISIAGGGNTASGHRGTEIRSSLQRGGSSAVGLAMCENMTRDYQCKWWGMKIKK